MGLDTTNLPAAFTSKMGAQDIPKHALQTLVTNTEVIITPSSDEKKLNKLEKAWLRQLRLTHPEGNIGIQNITLKLADDCRYTPDFNTIDANGQIVFWETKGGLFRDDAKVKIKVAARLYRWARFNLVTKASAKLGGTFTITPVNP